MVVVMKLLFFVQVVVRIPNVTETSRAAVNFEEDRSCGEELVRR